VNWGNSSSGGSENVRQELCIVAGCGALSGREKPDTVPERLFTLAALCPLCARS
jgi:hypothetical protein